MHEPACNWDPASVSTSYFVSYFDPGLYVGPGIYARPGFKPRFYGRHVWSHWV